MRCNPSVSRFKISVKQLHATALKQWLDDSGRKQPLLLDVREAWEFTYCRIEGSSLLPLGQLAEQIATLEADAEIVVICHLGVRSYRAALILEHAGFSNVYNLQGGVEAWARDVDPTLRRY